MRADDGSGPGAVIFVDPNAPMYLVGAPHPHKVDASLRLQLDLEKPGVPIHQVLWPRGGHPAPDRDTLIAKLSTAAKRALARLPR